MNTNTATIETVNYVATNVKLVSENYPYGYTLKTTKYDYLEFKKNKGFRHVSQTINPKTGRLNAPKASTYAPVLLLRKDANDHVKCGGCGFNGNKEMNNGCKFVAANFDCFTDEQIKYIYGEVLQYLIVGMKAAVIYCGSKLEDLKPLFEPAIKIATEGVKNGGNMFANIVLDIEAIEATKQPDYQPFKITNYSIIG